MMQVQNSRSFLRSILKQARRRREDNLVEIRKNKREDNLLKKRMLLQSQQLPTDASQTPFNIEKRSMSEALENQVKSKVTIKGHLQAYRFCDNVWTFILQDALFKYDEVQENVVRVKIVACDSKLLTQ